jgi:hypothetical protein
VNRDLDQEKAAPTATSDELDGLHFVAVIGNRRLYFEAIPAQCRFRVTMAHVWAGKAEALGSVIRLDTDEPGLRVCAPMEVEWATRYAEKVVAEAVMIWGSITRGCEG